MSYEVILIYFNSLGKRRNQGGKYVTKLKKFYEIIQEVQDKHRYCELPCLEYGANENFVLVDVPSHPANIQYILKPCKHEVRTK